MLGCGWPRRALPRKPRATIALAGLVAVLVGCKPAVRWELKTYPDAHKKAVAANKPTFVYFRSWYDVKCTQFEDKVLSDPAVTTALQPLVCVPLEYGWDKPLAEKWGLSGTPAYAILDPAENVLAKGQGDAVTKETLVAAIREAVAQVAPTPASAPAGP